MAAPYHIHGELDILKEKEAGIHVDWKYDEVYTKTGRRRSSLANLKDLLLNPSILARKDYQGSCLKAVGKHLLPTHLFNVVCKQRPTRELRKTAALDGLRGISALGVVLYHFFVNFYPINFGFVVSHAPSMTIWNLPMVKFFYHGPAGVHIFFVISGYILSLRSLQQMKKQDMDSLVKTLSSSTFRRSFRLLAPITVSMFLEMCALQLGLFERARTAIRVGPLVPHRAPSVSIKFAQLLDNLKGLGNLFSWADYHNGNFDDDLWTIGFEYRCSMALFLLLLAICRIRKPWVRRTLVASLSIICRVYDRWDFILFIIGMLLADFDVFSDNDSKPKISGRHQPFWALVAFSGVFLCSHPMMGNAEVALGYKYIAPLGHIVYPLFPFRLAWSIGAGCLVAAAMHSIHLRYILESRCVQYLGRISYMLYVVHGPLLRSLGFMMVSMVWKCLTSNIMENSFAYTSGIVLGFALFLPALFWLADLATRLIDDNCVSVARWIEDQCIAS